jgi:hypothetical protein
MKRSIYIEAMFVFLILAIFLAFILLTKKVSAAELCARVNNTGWSQDQKNHSQPYAQQIMNRAYGLTDLPSKTEIDLLTELCFTDPLGDPRVVNRTSLDAEHTARLQAEIQYLQRLQARELEAQQELTFNPLTAEWLDTIDARINNVTSLAQTRIILKLIVRYLLAWQLTIGAR